MTYRYFLTQLPGDPTKYGLCEVCGKPAYPMYRQVEEYEYEPGQWTRYQCHELFGCEACMLSKRR